MTCSLQILKLISTCVLLASPLLVEVYAVWKCDKHCETRYEGPFGKDADRLSAVQHKNPLAERDWRFFCVELDALELLAEYDDRKCDPGPELKAKIVPGAELMQVGYNIATGKQTTPKLMDLVSRKGNGTVFDISTNTCFALPDAFVPKRMYIYEGGPRITSEFRPDPELVSKMHGYKNGQLNLIDKNAPYFWWSTYTHSLTLSSPVPTPELVAQWKALLGAAAAGPELGSAFVKYFESFGTHYFHSASIGGELNVRVVPNRVAEFPSNQNIEVWGNCVAERLSEIFIRGTDKSGSSERAAEHGSQDCPPRSELISEFRITCIGGDVTSCPKDLEVSPEQIKEFDAWKATVAKQLGPVHAYVRPIYELVDEVLHGMKNSETT